METDLQDGWRQTKGFKIMEFAGVNYIAVAVATVAGYAFGSVYYMLLGDAWMSALGKTKEEMKPSPGPFIAAFICQGVMAFVLAGLIGHLGNEGYTIVNGIISGAFCWFGFVVTSIIVNHGFQGASLKLTVIDSAHWLGVLVIMGAIIGWFGV